MFREMRRKDRSIENERSVKILENGAYGILSTIGENGYAYGVPISYIYRDGSIYFHCAVEGSKLDNINYNNKVSFCVVGNTEPLPEKFSCRYESVIAFGRTEEMHGKEKLDALTGLIQKYASEFTEKGAQYIQNDIDNTTVIKITVEHMTGKARN